MKVKTRILNVLRFLVEIVSFSCDPETLIYCCFRYSSPTNCARGLVQLSGRDQV